MHTSKVLGCLVMLKTIAVEKNHCGSQLSLLGRSQDYRTTHFFLLDKCALSLTC